ncbi:unnamed protein product [Ectocarpus sp. CCAP 1310/34]|nr:unnamed protein product [Ectocarpus sp. CCAP 1310/34]
MTGSGRISSSSSTERLRTILTGAEAAIFDLICAGASIEPWAEWLRTPLEHAVAAGKTDLVVQLAQAGAGGIAVHSAVRRGQEVVVAELLRLGASPGEPDESGDTPLHVAVRHGHHSILALLLLQRADPDALDGNDHTPLHVAAEQGSRAAVEALVSTHADLILRFGDEDRSAMDNTAYVGHVDLMRMLKQHGVDVCDVGAACMTPLHIAAAQAQVPAARVLVEAGADARAEDGAGDTPLHLAARTASVNAVATLLSHGADANKLHGDRLSALHLAVKDGAADMVHALLAAGAQPNLRAGEDDQMGLSALHLAISNKNTVVIDALVEAGAEVDAQMVQHVKHPDANNVNGDQFSALQLAAEGGSAAIVHVLLAEGAQPNLRGGEDGKTALDLATVGGHAEAVTALLLHRPSLNVMDKLARTAMHSAASNNNVAVIDVFAAAGGFAEAVTALMRHGGGGHGAAVTALLVGGANPNLLTDDGSSPLGRPRGGGYRRGTPLHEALRSGCFETTAALLECGADPTKWTASNRGLIHEAAQGSSASCVELNLAGSADINLRDDEESTALHAAAGHSTSIVEKLLEHGADPDSRDSDGNGRNPLLVAAYSHMRADMKTLLRSGADIRARGNDGRSPLHLGVDGWIDLADVRALVDLLLRWGADEIAKDDGDDSQDSRSPGELWEYRVGVTDTTHAEVPPIGKLLKDTQKDRTWRRRGWLVLCHAFTYKVRLKADNGGANAGTGRSVRVGGVTAASSHGVCGGTPHGRVGRGLNGVVATMVGLEEGFFRNIVEFL